MRPGPVKELEPEFLTGPGLVRDAFEFAVDAHLGQERKGDGSPYIRHPIAVARLLEANGLADDAMLAACFLHDVVEDTPTGMAEIRERFGDDVGDLVAAMTEDKDLEPYELRKDRHRDQVEAAGDRATRIYVADKIANLRDLRAAYASTGEEVAARFKAPLDVRVRIWRGDLEMAERAVPGLPLHR